MSVPPYSSLTVMPCTPRSPSFFHRSAGNSFTRSISAARGAISAAQKDCSVSRRASMVSPRLKFRLGTFMGCLLLEVVLARWARSAKSIMDGACPGMGGD